MRLTAFVESNIKTMTGVDEGSKSDFSSAESNKKEEIENENYDKI